MENACSGFGPHRKIEIEEADGSSSGQNEYDLAVPFHGGFLVWRWRKISLLQPPSIGKVYGLVNGTQNKKKHGRNRFERFRCGDRREDLQER